MAATMYVHIFEGITEDDLAAFFSIVLGSKWFDPNDSRPQGERRQAYAKIDETPSVEIGEVSWLKAAFCETDEEAAAFVPGPVQTVSDLVGEDLPELDDELVASILAALKLENATGYDVASPQEVKPFLDAHRGKRVFTVSW